MRTIILFYLLCGVTISTGIVYSGLYNAEDSSFRIISGTDSNAICQAEWYDELNKTGWGRLYIKTYNLPTSSDPLQMRCAGLLEGYSTSKQIHLWFQSWRNNEFKGKNVTNKISKFLSQQMKFARTAGNVREPLKTHIKLIMNQFDGMYEGYQMARNENPSLIQFTSLEMYALTSDGDLETLEDIFPADTVRSAKRREEREKKLKKSRESARRSDEKTSVYIDDSLQKDDVKIPEMLDCSGMVKIVGGEMYSGHTTWTRYYSMYRILKSLETDLNAPTASNRVSYSSRPAFLASKDDFYVMDSGLVAWETTNSILDDSLYYFVNPRTLLSWQRAILSNRLARSGKEWVDIFSKHNSGTYNNQWVVTDYNRFMKNKEVVKGTLWIAEQMPGRVYTKDVSEELRNKSFWPSFNVPYLAKTYARSGYGKCTRDGACGDYVEDPRNVLFTELAGGINDLEGFKSVMQHNDYKKDVVSKGHPSIAISSRYDLEVKKTAAFGGIDSKVVSSVLLQNSFSFDAISGPSHQSIDPFDWNKGNWSTIWHEGQPQLWNFDWQNFVHH